MANKKENGSPRREPGALAFAAVVLLLGGAAFAMALRLWLEMKEPREASAAALPLFVSALWVLMALWNLLACRAAEDGRKRAEAAEPLRHALPPRVLGMLGMIAAFCLLLYLGVGFVIAAPLFLYAAMCFLLRGDYGRNLLRAAAVTALIVLVFRAAFGVVLP